MTVHPFAPISRVCGFFSMIASAFIVYEVLSDKKKLQKTYFCLMLSMSFIEFCDGLAFFLNEWCIYGSDMETGYAAPPCQFQGFLFLAGIGSSVYNATLALYYVLVIKYSWSERWLRSKAEPWMHLIPLLIGYGTATVGVVLGMYRVIPGHNLCFIGRTPFGCKETYQYGFTDCLQGDGSSLFVILSLTMWEWGVFVWTAACMLIIWLHVRSLEDRNNNYTFAGDDTKKRANRKQSAKIMTQGAFYVGVYFCCHIFSATVSVARDYAPNFVPYVWLDVMVALTYPLEGFMNFLVYIRPRMIRYFKKRQKADKSTRVSSGRRSIPLNQNEKDNNVTNNSKEVCGGDGGDDHASPNDFKVSDMMKTNDDEFIEEGDEEGLDETEQRVVGDYDETIGDENNNNTGIQAEENNNKNNNNNPRDRKYGEKKLRFSSSLPNINENSTERSAPTFRGGTPLPSAPSYYKRHFSMANLFSARHLPDITSSELIRDDEEQEELGAF